MLGVQKYELALVMLAQWKEAGRLAQARSETEVGVIDGATAKQSGGPSRPAATQKVAAVDRRSRPPTQIIANAAQAAQQSYGGGLFGSGLTTQPKLKWPGD